MPLIVPEVNGALLEEPLEVGIVANPNCVAIPLSLALAPLQKAVGIKRVVVSTYQSVSGAGRAPNPRFPLRSRVRPAHPRRHARDGSAVGLIRTAGAWTLHRNW